MLLLSACYGLQKPDKPENLLSEDKMVNVLIDLSLVSAAKGINKRELENRGIVPDSFVYNKHKIDSLQFANSNNYYTYDIEVYTNIYTRVKDSLEKLRGFYRNDDSIKKAEKKRKLEQEKKPKNLKAARKIDSIKRLKKPILQKQ